MNAKNRQKLNLVLLFALSSIMSLKASAQIPENANFMTCESSSDNASGITIRIESGVYTQPNLISFNINSSRNGSHYMSWGYINKKYFEFIQNKNWKALDGQSSTEQENYGLGGPQTTEFHYRNGKLDVIRSGKRNSDGMTFAVKYFSCG